VHNSGLGAPLADFPIENLFLVQSQRGITYSTAEQPWPQPF